MDIFVESAEAMVICALGIPINLDGVTHFYLLF